VTLATLIRKSLFERKLRTLLLTISVFIGFLIFGVLVGFLITLGAPPSASESDELMVANRIGLLQGLPVAYGRRIAGVPGIKTVSQANLFAGTWKEEKNVLGLLLVEPESFLALEGKRIALPAAQRAAFLSQRDALVVDRKTAERWGWHLGDQVTLRSKQYVSKDGSTQWPFQVVGIFDAGLPDEPVTGIFGNYNYINENLPFGQDVVHWYTIKTGDPRRNDAVAQAVDKMFANSPDETKTQPAQAFAQAFLAQLGDVKLIVTLVVSAGFIAIIFIVGNTMGLAIRQRRKQIATLKTIGFGPGRILTLVIGELLLLWAIGGLLGLFAASLLLRGIAASTGDAKGGLPTLVLAAGIALIFILSLLTGGGPAWRALRLKPVDALART
jgi:putative ABC transport system permease protein